MKKTIYGISLIIFSILVFVLLFTILEDISYVDIIILILLILITIIFMILFVFELKGQKEYIINETTIIIKRKNKMLDIIQKKEIFNVIKTFDAITGELIYVILKYKKKREKIIVSKKNSDNIKQFVDKIPYKNKKNYLYYFITLFIYGSY